jgi:hypothetical protein
VVGGEGERHLVCADLQMGSCQSEVFSSKQDYTNEADLILTLRGLFKVIWFKFEMLISSSNTIDY